MDDSRIVDLYLSRDETALLLTKQQYGKKLRMISDNILNDLSSAEECENDTYLEAWKLIPPNEPRTYLFAFLGRIIRHLSIDRCRKSNAQKRSAVFCELTQEMQECIPESVSIDDEIDAAALSNTIDLFLSKESLEQRNVFVRRYWYFDSISEISGRYGFSQSKVKTMLHRSREKLRIILEKEGYTI